MGDEQIGQPQLAPAGRAADSGSARGSTHRAPTPARPARPASATAPGRGRWRCAAAARRRTRAETDRPTCSGSPTRSSSSQHPLAHVAGRQRFVGDQRFGDDVADPHARVERGERVLEHRLHRLAIVPPPGLVERRAGRAHRSGCCRRSGSSRPSTSLAVVVLPQPDSPTTPRVCPLSMANEMSSTARTTPRPPPKMPRRPGNAC